MTATRQPRQYIQLSDASVKAIVCAINSFNSVYGDYKVENTLILVSNAWELLAKSILVKRKKNIYTDRKKEKTISCEEAINKLVHFKELELTQAELLQQIISLRNRCSHENLPPVPEAIQHHLLFFSCKFFKELLIKHFPKKKSLLSKNFLTLSFDHMTTYSDTVQKLVSKLRTVGKDHKELIWLLERGVRYVESSDYISQDAFEKLYINKKKITPYLKVGDYLDKAEMLRVVPIQAPKNYSADIELRKGGKKLSGTLPVSISKSNVDEDYPLLNNDIAKKLKKSSSYIAKCMSKLDLKGNKDYHQAIRVSKSGSVQRYSKKALNFLEDYLKKNPNYNPY